jgi:hypothetical protein
MSRKTVFIAFGVAFSAVLVSDVVLMALVHSMRNREAETARGLAPQVGRKVLSFSGEFPRRGMRIGDQHTEFDTRQGLVLAFVAQAKCEPCEHAVPKWESLVRQARKLGSLRVLVLDIQGASTFDDLDERLTPDARFTPSAETILSERLLESPITMLIRDGVYESVINGEPSTQDEVALLKLVGGSQ